MAGHRGPGRGVPLVALLASLFVGASCLDAQVVVRGTVVDSTRTGADVPDSPFPLEGAHVQARRSDLQVEADSDAEGRFHLDLPEAGVWELTFRHDRLDALGIEDMGWSPVTVSSDGVVGAELAIPSLPTLLALTCGRTPGVGEDGIVAGWVRSSLTGDPLPDIALELRPRPGATGAAPAFSTRTEGDGLFVFCHVPAGAPYRLHVDVHQVESADREVEVGGGAVVSEEFTFEVGERGDVWGTVEEADGGTPVASAVVELAGPVTRSAESDDEGRFRMDSLPAGRYAVRVRHLGFQEVERDVFLPGRQEEVELGVRLSRDAVGLEPIVVRGEGRHRATFGPLADVQERREWLERLGHGRIFDRDDIRASNAMRVNHLVSRMVGVRSEPIPGSPELRVFLNQRRCRPSYYLDGIRRAGGLSAIPLSDIEFVEVYRRSTELPGEFLDNQSFFCGAIAVWTRRGH